MPKSKFYAVARGRSPCPNVYRSWDECNAKVNRFPGAVFKSFDSKEDAETWLGSKYIHQAPTQPAASEPLRGQKPYSRPLRSQPSASKPIQTPENAANPPIAEASTMSVTLSEEQSLVLERVRQGKNTFFSGSAGTGKSVLLREIIKNLREMHRTLGITASTGIAAINIGGCTLHSWAGIGIGTESAKKITGKFFGQQQIYERVLERWRNVKTLIIDEISMVDGELFDKLEEMARILRKSDAPFGGIQLVLSGDFFQLPPVPSRQPNGVVIPAKFAFDSTTWESCMGPPVTLTRVFRQKDRAFVDLLNAMRFGKIENVAAFQALAREVKYSDGIQPTELLSRRDEVDRANYSRLNQLPGTCETYLAMEYAGLNSKGERVSPQQMEKLLERLVVPNTIRLKVGAQVMLVKNLVQGHLVNGSVGQVLRFSTAADAAKQHLEIAKVDGNAAQAASPRGARDQLWPIVRFTNGLELLMTPQEFTINNADGEMEARRDQVPLILAWALSVHKSQGQTIERVRVDLKNTFEKGQAYVAVSRATTMEGLQIRNFIASRVMAHPRVLEWHAVCQKQGMEVDESEWEAGMEEYHSWT